LQPALNPESRDGDGEAMQANRGRRGDRPPYGQYGRYRSDRLAPRHCDAEEGPRSLGLGFAAVIRRKKNINRAGKALLGTHPHRAGRNGSGCRQSGNEGMRE